MSDAAEAMLPGRRLRVAVMTRDPARAAALRRVLLDAGHDVVDAQGARDVLLADADCPVSDERPVVVLGSADGDHAGRIARDADARQIDAALRAAAVGLIVRSPEVRAGGFRAIKEHPAQALLTPREMEVLRAIADGMTNKVIARRLDISLHTVKFHVESLFRKLGVRTRSEAVARAAERLRRGAIEL